MKFEEYLSLVVPKIGPNSAFSLFRDVQMKAIMNILKEKKIATDAEMEAEIEKQLGEMAKNISKMPSIPKEETNDGGKKPN